MKSLVVVADDPLTIRSNRFALRHAAGFRVIATIDGRGSAQVRFTYIDGQTGATDPRNVLIYEDLSNHGEGANVLFADGSVRFLTIDERKQAVRETYARLKREADLPPEFK